MCFGAERIWMSPVTRPKLHAPFYEPPIEFYFEMSVRDFTGIRLNRRIEKSSRVESSRDQSPTNPKEFRVINKMSAESAKQSHPSVKRSLRFPRASSPSISSVSLVFERNSNNRRRRLAFQASQTFLPSARIACCFAFRATKRQLSSSPSPYKSALRLFFLERRILFFFCFFVFFFFLFFRLVCSQPRFSNAVGLVAGIFARLVSSRYFMAGNSRGEQRACNG